MSDRVSRTRRGFLATASAVTAALSGCVATGRGATETVTETIDPANVEAVSASTPIGDLLVTEATGETGAVRVEQAAGVESDLDAITVDVERDDERLRIDVDIDDDETAFLLGPGPKADLEVTLPAGVELSHSETVNGDVDVDDIAAPISVATTNGNVDVITTGADVRAETTNGDVRVEVDAADVRASSTNGDVDVLAPEDLDARVSLSTTNGAASIEGFEGAADSTAESSLVETIGEGTYDIEASTTNGDVEGHGQPQNENT